MMSAVFEKLLRRDHLTASEATAVMEWMMDGGATPAQIGALLVGLRMKGESVTEVVSFARVMRHRAHRVHVQGYAIDTCGTGGDGAATFNISTAVALVAAAGGVTVVKHGNRAVSSRCGSADVLEQLGVTLSDHPEEVSACVRDIGIGFMFAPHFHLAMKHVLQPRRDLGVRTVFNILGPLTNPARVQGQVLGVFAPEWVRPMAEVLHELGTERAMVVHGLDGLDEISLTTQTKVAELRDGHIREYELDPSDYGFALTTVSQLRGGTPPENAQIIRGIFAGEQGPRSDAVVLNAAAALYVGKQASSLAEGVMMAGAVLQQGRALAKLEQLAAYHKRCDVS